MSLIVTKEITNELLTCEDMLAQMGTPAELLFFAEILIISIHEFLVLYLLLYFVLPLSFPLSS